MSKTLKLQIVTPEATVYSDDVDMVTLPAVEGQIGILPNHVRLMTQMVPGEMIVRKGGQPVFLAVGGGLVEVTGESVSILTDLAVAAENIDEAKAEEARQHVPDSREDLRRRSGFSQCLISSVTGATARQASPAGMMGRTIRRTADYGLCT
jgi:F-type H+-transporting ATPase subunit epsilon